MWSVDTPGQQMIARLDIDHWEHENEIDCIPLIENYDNAVQYERNRNHIQETLQDA